MNFWTEGSLKSWFFKLQPPMKKGASSFLQAWWKTNSNVYYKVSSIKVCYGWRTTMRIPRAIFGEPRTEPWVYVLKRNFINFTIVNFDSIWPNNSSSLDMNFLDALWGPLELSNSGTSHPIASNLTKALLLEWDNIANWRLTPFLTIVETSGIVSWPWLIIISVIVNKSPNVLTHLRYLHFHARFFIWKICSLSYVYTIFHFFLWSLCGKLIHATIILLTIPYDFMHL